MILDMRFQVVHFELPGSKGTLLFSLFFFHVFRTFFHERLYYEAENLFPFDSRWCIRGWLDFTYVDQNERHSAQLTVFKRTNQVHVGRHRNLQMQAK